MVAIENEIKTYLETVLSTRIAKYYTGEVKVVPQSYLPALTVMGTNTEIEAKTTASDINRWTIVITVITDLKKYFDEAGTGTTIKSDEDLKKIMEERNSDGSYKDNTVVYALRHYLRGSKYKFNNNLSIEYKVIDNPEFPYCRAVLTATAYSDLILRPYP
jgi:hypothetical protein